MNILGVIFLCLVVGGLWSLVADPMGAWVYDLRNRRVDR